MRKILIVLTLLLAGALFSGSPAKAELGCTCVKLGQPAVCTGTVAKCAFGIHGVCVAPCELPAAKVSKRKVRHHKLRHHKSRHHKVSHAKKA